MATKDRRSNQHVPVNLRGFIRDERTTRTAGILLILLSFFAGIFHQLPVHLEQRFPAWYRKIQWVVCSAPTEKPLISLEIWVQLPATCSSINGMA